MYRGVEHSDSDESDKSDSSDSEYMSDDEQKPKSTNPSNSVHKDSKKMQRLPSAQGQDQDDAPASAGGTAAGDKKSSDLQTKEKISGGVEKDPPEKNKPPPQTPREEGRTAVPDMDVDSDSERELVIDLGEEAGRREKKKAKRDTAPTPISTPKDQSAVKTEGRYHTFWILFHLLIFCLIFVRSSIQVKLLLQPAYRILRPQRTSRLPPIPVPKTRPRRPSNRQPPSRPYPPLQPP